MKLTSFATLRQFAALALLPFLAVPPSFGWGNDGHRMINRLAAEKLPSDMPAFLRTPDALNEIEYLGPEPDRWRSPNEPELNAAQAPEHFIDLEIADLTLDSKGQLPRRRFDYIAALYAASLTHPRQASDLRPERAGLQPWEAVEVYERLQAAMREYRNLSAQHEDTKPVQQAILFYAGWLGHYAGDGSMPLHVTVNYDGWVGKDNPNGYTTQHGIHSLFESTFVHANIKSADIAPRMTEPKKLNDVFVDYVAYLRHSGTQIERVYQIEKAQGFVGAGTAESREFTAERLAAGASMLRDMIYTAWIESAKPVPAWQDRSAKPAAELPKKDGM